MDGEEWKKSVVRRQRGEQRCFLIISSFLLVVHRKKVFASHALCLDLRNVNFVCVGNFADKKYASALFFYVAARFCVLLCIRPLCLLHSFFVSFLLQ